MPLSEQRARTVVKELLSFRGWDLRPISSGGQLLEESEYRDYSVLADWFKSKTGPGIGKPDFLLVDSAANLKPLAVIDTKPRAADIRKSITDTQHYANSIHAHGHDALAVAVAGAEKELCEVKVQRQKNGTWQNLTLRNEPIDWIPSPDQTRYVLSKKGLLEVAPERPSEKVLAAQANRLNEILRECTISDALRPMYAAAFILGTWESGVSTEPNVVLEQINANTKRAMRRASKAELSESIHIDPENEELSARAWEIIDILDRLSLRHFIHEHDYLGQLYETFFRYTGGNTIGQYFTPRHIIAFMCELVRVSPSDVVFDPACGTGGFLIGALNRMIRGNKMEYEVAISKVKNNVFGMEAEPTTAALCITNMILRGDGKSGIIQKNCFKILNFPPVPADIALLNPPFPHKRKKAQKPASAFIDRALHSVKDKGLVAAIVPYSLLANVKEWHHRILKNNRLVFAATLPADLFNPYSNYDTAIVLLEKGVPHANQRTFFARIDNDGYKLKKTTRVPRQEGGSQLLALLDAFDKKCDIPQFTAYKPLSVRSDEWSPETFIESAPYTDEEFIAGFEEIIRKQAAFYVRYGHRLMPRGENPSGLNIVENAFSSRSNVSLTGVHLERFRVADLFSIKMGGKDEIEDLDDGPDPFVSTSAWDNGVTTWKRANRLFPAPAITVATDGSAYTSFVQEFPFYAFYKVAVVRPLQRREVPIDALYYVAYLLNREEWRFVRARKFGKTRIENTLLYAPSKNGRPDFEMMAKLVRRTAAFPIIQAFREARRQLLEQHFVGLAAKWKAVNKFTSSVSRMIVDPSYHEIIRMGDVATPLLLAELEHEPDHWFAALEAITGANPVSKDAAGNIDKMANAWLRWGKREGYSWAKSQTN